MSILKKYISPILTVTVLIFFGLYLYNNPDIISQVTSVKWIFILFIIILYIFVIFLEGLFVLVALKIFNRAISIKESFFLAIISRIGNYLLPVSTGAIFRASYLKKKYNFEYTKFLSLLYGYIVIFFLINSIIGLIVLLIKYFQLEQLYNSLIIFFSGTILLMIVLMYVRFPWKKVIKKDTGLIGSLISHFERFLSGWDLIVKNTKSFVLLLCIALVNIFLSTLIIYIEFISIGKMVDLLGVILYTCISGLSLLFSITPGSLGVREGAFLASSDAIGLAKDEIMQLAFLDRGIMFILLLFCLIFILMFSKKLTLKEIFFGKEIKEG